MHEDTLYIISTSPHQVLRSSFHKIYGFETLTNTLSNAMEKVKHSPMSH